MSNKKTDWVIKRYEGRIQQLTQRAEQLTQEAETIKEVVETLKSLKRERCDFKLSPIRKSYCEYILETIEKMAPAKEKQLAIYWKR